MPVACLVVLSSEYSFYVQEWLLVSPITSGTGLWVLAEVMQRRTCQLADKNSAPLLLDIYTAEHRHAACCGLGDADSCSVLLNITYKMPQYQEVLDLPR